MLTAFIGLGSAVRSGEFAYWVENGCVSSTTPARIMRRRMDGTDTPLLLAEGTDSDVVRLEVKGDYIYYRDTRKLKRVAK